MKGLPSVDQTGGSIDEWLISGDATVSPSVDSMELSSFMMAGFECTYAQTADGSRMDLLHASRHDSRVREDYEMLLDVGISTVREGLSWSQIDLGNRTYNFERFEEMMRGAREAGIQQIWDLNHFDFPDRLDPLSGEFLTAFAEYAVRAVNAIRKYDHGEIYIVPMNEPSFFAWMSDCGLWAPFIRGESHLFKRQLVRAAIAAIEAIKSIDSSVRFIHPDPFMYRRPARMTNLADVSYAEGFNETVRFECWDMLSGRIEPELGGRPEYLDIVGINYYFHNQQFARVDENGELSFKTIPLKDPQRVPLDGVIRHVHERYGRPVIVTETGSYRRRRPIWWNYVLDRTREALSEELPLYGLCSYPTLDIIRGAGFILPKSGLWDFDQSDPECARIPHDETLSLIRRFIGERSSSLRLAAAA